VKLNFQNTKLGGGTFGSVSLGDWNGIKIAAKELMEGTIVSLLEEASIIKQLRHPNVVLFYGLLKKR